MVLGSSWLGSGWERGGEGRDGGSGRAKIEVGVVGLEAGVTDEVVCL